MKTAFKSIFLLLCTILLVSCGKGDKKEKTVAEKYCGVELTGFEVMDLRKIGDAGYNYTADDKVLHTDITTTVNKLFNDTKKIEFFFFQRDKDVISMYVMGPDDKAVVEKVSCYILENDFNGRLPKTRKLLFYTPEHNTLVAAIKSK